MSDVVGESPVPDSGEAEHFRRLAAMYAAASPFPHGVVSPLCADASLRAVQAEMREHLTATFKETDLFKVLQTGDLVTIDRANPELVPKIPNLLRLRAAIYSPEFREMVQRRTGCAKRRSCKSLAVNRPPSPRSIRQTILPPPLPRLARPASLRPAATAMTARASGASPVQMASTRWTCPPRR